MEFWQRLSARAKAGLAAGLLLIVALAGGLAYWAYHTDYQVLFADLSSGDASSMVAELDRMKTPYQLSDGGHTILVPQDMVYKTRLKVMGKDLPLHGAVGFEVFNNADFGMTEFVQKVNYQRAVQGELTRTIMAMDDVSAARVHLAIPEQGLFKKSQSKPKASVSLVIKPGHALSAEQIAGVQRLVAASVPEMQAMDVTVLDQHGVSLTKAMSGDGMVEAAQTQLDSKRSLEDYLHKKLTGVLDNMFGAGSTIASVDVVLNLDTNRITTEDVLPAKSATTDGAPTGVVVRERQSNQNPPQANDKASASAAGSNTVEADYQVGRRVEQLAIAPGATRRMTVAVVVKKSLTHEQIDHVREVVSLALGVNPQRGDAIVIQSLDQLISSAASDGKSASMVEAPVAAKPMSPRPETMNAGDMPPPRVRERSVGPEWVIGLLLLLGLIPVFFLWKGGVRADAASRRPPMNQQERDQLLRDLQAWIREGGQGGRT